MGIDHPCMGTIFASRVHASPATIAKADFINVRIECELAVKLGRDLPKAAAPYTRESVRAAVTHIMPAFELIEDRFADYKSSKALSLIADNAWNGGIVIGAAMPLPAGLDLDGIAGVLKSNGKEAGSGKTDDPLGALAWLANQAVECGRPHDGGHGGDHRQRHRHRRHRAGRAPRLRARRRRRDVADGEVRAAAATARSPAANVSGSGRVHVVSCLGARSGRVPSTEREPPA